jgi:large subunit ribosomal protein L32
MVQMKRHTSSARKRRRSHMALKPQTLNKCPKCGKAVKPHQACRFCGTYRLAQVIKPKVAKIAKK